MQPSVKCLVSARIPSEFGQQKPGWSDPRILLYSAEGGDSTQQHLVMVFGDEFMSKSLEEVREGDSSASLTKRGATLWKQVEKYKCLKLDPDCVWRDGGDNGDLDIFMNATSASVAMNGNVSAASSDSDATAVHQPPSTLNDDSIKDPLVRIHSSCFTGETLGSLRCDCAEQLHTAISQMSALNSGLLVYLHQEGRGIGLLSKLFAYNLIDTQKFDTYSANVALGHEPDEREYGIAALILKDLGVDQCRLLTNNPDKMNQLQRDGIKISSRVPMVPQSWSADETKDSTVQRSVQDRDGYLVTKIKKMGHQLHIPAFLDHDDSAHS